MRLISRRQFPCEFLGLLASGPLIPPLTGASWQERETRRPSLTDLEGIWVGHETLKERPTGCTVVLCASSFVAGVDVRGGAPGTRETDLLRAENLVSRVDAIVLSGGSAFGLDTASGVMQFLDERNRGFDAQVARVPIVCGAILFDLGLGDPKIRPDARSGYRAALAASNAPVPEGNVGAGSGATVGKLLGPDRAMKGGLGSWAHRRADGLSVGAVVAVNCVGDVMDPAEGRIVAGARRADDTGFVDVLQLLRNGATPAARVGENTVIGVVATNVALSKPQCNKVAQMAHDGLARCIRPSHTPWDGDTLFAVSTGKWTGSADEGLVGALAADVLSTAILRGLTQASSWQSYPAARDYPKTDKPA